MFRRTYLGEARFESDTSISVLPFMTWEVEPLIFLFLKYKKEFSKSNRRMVTLSLEEKTLITLLFII